MLPFDQKPWAKTVAAIVITLSFVGAICLTGYFHSIDALHPSEIVGIILLLLTIVPPNAAVVLRKAGDESGVSRNQLPHTR
jgi:hypothetical protein